MFVENVLFTLWDCISNIIHVDSAYNVGLQDFEWLLK